MRKLRGQPRIGKPARAAVVVPNGTLFGDGVVPGSRMTAEGLQPAHDCSLPQWRLCPLYRDPHEPPLLRLLRADQGGLVLRAAAARGPKELLEDPAHPVRGVCRL